MSDDFNNRVAHQAAREFSARRAALNADFACHAQNQDEVSASQTLQDLAKLDLEEQAAADLYRRHQDAQRPVQDYASAEQRQARQPNEMTAQDMADLMNTSRHRGRGFTASDYHQLRSGLNWYKTARGLESK